MQFKIQYINYTEEGTLTNNVHADYFTTADEADKRYNELNNLRYSNGNKCFKVTLQVAGYKTIEDAAAFFAQFKM